MFDVSLAEKIATLRKLFERETAAGLVTRDSVVIDQIIHDLHRKAEQTEGS